MIPEGYEKLAVIGIAWKGNYTDGTAYKLMNAVYYEGSTFVALKDDPVTPPAADNTNWTYLAKGFGEQLLSAVTALDTSGVVGAAGEQVGAQVLMDAIADKVMTKLLAKSQIVNNLLATDPTTVLAAPMGKTLSDKDADLQRQVTQLNGDLGTFEGRFNFLSADRVEFDNVNQASFYKTVKDGVIYQAAFTPSEFAYDKLQNGVWDPIWKMSFENTMGADIFHEPRNNVQIVKWKLNPSSYFQLVVGADGLKYDHWDGRTWTNIWHIPRP